MKHSYRQDCDCDRCVAERARRTRQGTRTTAEVMIDWRGSRNGRRARVASEYWDAFESGVPMSEDDR